MKKYQRYTISTYNQYADVYKNLRNSLMPFEEANKFVNLLGGKKILDAGTGPGRDAMYFASLDYNVIAIDLCEKFVRMNVKSKGNIHFILMDISHLSFPDCEFDGIWCNAVLSHFKKSDLLQPLRELHRVLKKNGTVFFSVKEGSGEGKQFEKEFNGMPRYMSYFLEDEFVSEIVNVGFSVTISYIYNETERFGKNHRNINFVFCFATKL